MSLRKIETESDARATGQPCASDSIVSLLVFRLKFVSRKALSMARRIAKVMAWLFGGALALALVAYVVLLAANLNDRPPAAEIATLTALQDSAPPILRSDNAYLFMLGFPGPPDADPFRLGSERYEWMERAGPEFDRAGDPLGEELGRMKPLRSDLSISSLSSRSSCGGIL
jgi:hypothetical protein